MAPPQWRTIFIPTTARRALSKEAWANLDGRSENRHHREVKDRMISAFAIAVRRLNGKVRFAISQKFTAGFRCFGRCFSLLFCASASPKARKSAAEGGLPAVFFRN